MIAASVLLYGPQGSGKTTLAPYLATKLGLHSVIEIDGHGRTPWPAAGALLVAHEPQDARGFIGQRIHVDEAKRLLGVKSLAQLLNNHH